MCVYLWVWFCVYVFMCNISYVYNNKQQHDEAFFCCYFCTSSTTAVAAFSLPWLSFTALHTLSTSLDARPFTLTPLHQWNSHLQQRVHAYLRQWIYTICVCVCVHVILACPLIAWYVIIVHVRKLFCCRLSGTAPKRLTFRSETKCTAMDLLWRRVKINEHTI